MIIGQGLINSLSCELKPQEQVEGSFNLVYKITLQVSDGSNIELEIFFPKDETSTQVVYFLAIITSATLVVERMGPKINPSINDADSKNLIYRFLVSEGDSRMNYSLSFIFPSNLSEDLVTQIASFLNEELEPLKIGDFVISYKLG